MHGLSGCKLFPFRQTAIGLSLILSRLGTIVAPSLGLLAKYHYVIPPLVYGGFSVLSGSLCLLLPETRRRELPDSVSEAVSSRWEAKVKTGWGGGGGARHWQGRSVSTPVQWNIFRWPGRMINGSVVAADVPDTVARSCHAHLVLFFPFTSQKKEHRRWQKQQRMSFSKAGMLDSVQWRHCGLLGRWHWAFITRQHDVQRRNVTRHFSPLTFTSCTAAVTKTSPPLFLNFINSICIIHVELTLTRLL